MINKKNLINRLILIICLFLLIGCGLNSNEKQQIEKDKDPAVSIATSFVKEKYGLEVEVKDVYGISKRVGKSDSYGGDMIVTLEDNKKIFYVWVNVEDKICKDNYQTDEIIKDLKNYLKEMTQGNIIGVHLETYKGVNGLTVLNKEVNTIFKKGAFFKDKYKKENFYEYISYANISVVMSDGSLSLLSKDISEKMTSYKNNGTFFVSDFIDLQSYELVKKNYSGNDDAIEQYATLLDESLEHRYVEDEVSYEETFSKSHHLYKKYKQKKIDNLVVSYQDNVTIQNDFDKLYDEIKEKVNNEIKTEMSQQSIKQCFKLTSKDELVSFSLALDGRVLDDYDIYSLSIKDNHISYYALNTSSYMINMTTYLLFNKTIDNELYIMVIKRIS